MVSLGDESRRSGGHFFSTEPPMDGDTDELLADPDSLGLSQRRIPLKFKRINTVWTTPILLLALVCLEVAVFVLPDWLSFRPILIYSLLLYSHVFIWILFFLADRLARWQHHLSRKLGYLEFYRDTCNLRRLPLYIVSTGNAVLLVLTTLLNECCTVPAATVQNNTQTTSFTPTPHTLHTTTAENITYTAPLTTQTPLRTPSDLHSTADPQSTPDATFYDVMNTTHSPQHYSSCLGLPLHMDKCTYLQIVFSIEVAVLLPLLGVYLVKVWRFNRRASAPDVLEQDTSTTSELEAHTSPMEIGFSEDPCMEEVMEKQAEMIRYLKEHNSALGKRVMELTALKTVSQHV